MLKLRQKCQNICNCPAFVVLCILTKLPIANITMTAFSILILSQQIFYSKPEIIFLIVRLKIMSHSFDAFSQSPFLFWNTARGSTKNLIDS